MIPLDLLHDIVQTARTMETASAPVRPTWTLTDKLNKARRSRGLTQKELADLLGLNITTLQKFERGELPMRRAYKLAWAMACGVPADWLMADEQDDNPPDGGLNNSGDDVGREQPWSETGIVPILKRVA